MNINHVNNTVKCLQKDIEPTIPWKRVDVDMIGPLTVNIPTDKFVLRALTMIDPATSWFKIKDVRETIPKIVWKRLMTRGCHAILTHNR